MGNLLHIDKITENRQAFQDKVISISDLLGIDPNWLMQVMYSESGLNHRAQNKSFPFKDGYATGLIQFVPNTAKNLGTSVNELYNMSNVQQLDYVLKYFRPFAGKLNSFIDMYFATFLPIAIGKPKNWVFQTDTLSASKIANSNPGFDLNKDSVLTVKEVESAMLKRVPEDYRETFKKKMTTKQIEIIAAIALVIFALAMAIQVYRKYFQSV